ncbi:hypothetical protein D3C79_974120 [compost metagenome]
MSRVQVRKRNELHIGDRFFSYLGLLVLVVRVPDVYIVSTNYFDSVPGGNRFVLVVDNPSPQNTSRVMWRSHGMGCCRELTTFAANCLRNDLPCLTFMA